LALLLRFALSKASPFGFKAFLRAARSFQEHRVPKKKARSAIQGEANQKREAQTTREREA